MVQKQAFEVVEKEVGPQRVIEAVDWALLSGDLQSEINSDCSKEKGGGNWVRSPKRHSQMPGLYHPSWRPGPGRKSAPDLERLIAAAKIPEIRLSPPYSVGMAYVFRKPHRSFRWEWHGTATEENRACLIAAVGWCSGWSELLTMIELTESSPAQVGPTKTGL